MAEWRRALGLGGRDVLGKVGDGDAAAAAFSSLTAAPDLLAVDRDGLRGCDADADVEPLISITSTTTSSPSMIFSPGRRVMMSMCGFLLGTGAMGCRATAAWPACVGDASPNSGARTGASGASLITW